MCLAVPLLLDWPGERYDVVTTLKDGVFPLVAAPFGKQATAARALVRTGSGEAPPPDAVSYTHLTLPTSDLV